MRDRVNTKAGKREYIADEFKRERTMVGHPIPGRPLDKAGMARHRRYREQRAVAGL